MVCSADSVERPSWRGWLHACAFALTIPAGLVLIVLADTAAARTSAAIYAASLAMMFGTSAAYHRLARSDVSRRWMQRADHSTIFLLIAGTYVPITMIVMPPRWGIPILVAIVTLAVTGIVLKTLVFERSQWFASALYPIMGWIAVITLPVLFDELTGAQLAFVIAGGLVYSLGIPVLFLRRPDPWPMTFGYHEVWHVFVIVAAGLHFAAVTSIVA
ncbi:PAQR family membrane homeostasis protein TrhA [Ilumatobacter nonamiensis]|uniref:PAQR family membrane homeostasis protein TrhA n=1 Tax=Ilumatobacter nonamiensis TaxID=467093 RepID=UPI000347260F|nr:hemolysin III family protein [Ilumatobacter nonamiensis]